jgi:murein L,D-transpeptidase YcbB/YkuD
MPLHVLYWTAWCDEEGTVHFGQDVYERDAVLARAMSEGPL